MVGSMAGVLLAGAQAQVTPQMMVAGPEDMMDRRSVGYVERCLEG